MSTYYFVPSRNVFGEGSVVETGELMKSLGGSKAMIVTDEFLASHPMTARIQKILKDAGVDSAVFGKAEPNPKDTNVWKGRSSITTTAATASSPWAAAPPTTAPRALAWWPPTAARSPTMKAWTRPTRPCPPGGREHHRRHRL